MTRRDDMLARALGRRPAGRPVGALAPCSAVDGYRAAAAQLYETLRALGPDAWAVAAHHGIGTVRDVVAHLVGVERLVLEWLTLPDGEHADPSEHLAAARVASRDLDGVAPERLTELWFDAVHRVSDACDAVAPSKVVLAHDLPTDVDGLMLLRAFELWSHLLDVTTATGLPMPDVDEPRLALMSSRLMGAVPIALALRDLMVDVAEVRFVLTGDGGGCYDIPLGPPGGDELTIVLDTVDVCRVAARRLAPDALDVTIDGDERAARTILSSLDAFARD
jgi:uncharacterized protein (TIGR03083 family)